MISETSRPLYRGVQLVWYFLYLVETLLAVRFVLKLLGANPGAAFSDLVYSLSYVFTWPFATVFRHDYVQGSIFEWSTLLAMLVYWLLAMAFIKLFVMSKSVSPVEADVRLSEEQ